MAIYSLIKHIIEGGLDSNVILRISIITIVAIIVKLILEAAANLMMHTAAFKTMQQLRMKVITHISKLNMGFFNHKGKGNIKTALFDDIGRLENFMAHNILELTNAIFVPIMLFILLLIIQPILAITLLIPGMLAIILPMRKMKAFPELTDRFTMTLGKLNSSIAEMVSTIKVLKMFKITAKKFKGYTDSVENYNDCLKCMAKVSCGPIAVTVVLLDASFLFILPVGGLLLLNGKISSSIFILFALLSICFYNALFSLMNIRMGFMELTSGMIHVQEILNIKPLIDGNEIIYRDDIKEVRFNNVSFAYDKKEVLKNINIQLKPNSIKAFVGTSGAGKSTAGQLLGKFWKVTKGSIKINGVNINNLKEESLMDLTAFVFQQVFLLEDSIYENISMGSGATMEEVKKAAKATYIHDFIMSLPKQYDTKVGSSGVKLSGGQKQRIAIARAILKDAPIVVLDEATSFSDIENERKIQKALESLLKDKITIMIAHRLHTIKNADNIVVFENGKILETGTHEELIQTHGSYRRMWNIYKKAN
ncbi:ABC transporter ATP-binding protein [Clostridium tetanomorphum]|uniref:ABC transporter ATP-binding protein n=1 Tax=Clostridium tetanomorphum TaxID=1553 RepID=A0A923J1D7_CLOTT|nr:ABC transporter ATP-binding protein [Clostridium tetanomorphum]MBC2399146.1 ABC transporter ATP-binding protein [Clostridium tetanomorphum]NRZ97995.1 ATP-binding cassette subfamily B protein [Clostridium tetanomorphum]